MGLFNRKRNVTVPNRPLSVRIGSDSFLIAPRDASEFEKLTVLYHEAVANYERSVHAADYAGALEAVNAFMCAALPDVPPERIRALGVMERTRVMTQEIPRVMGLVPPDPP